MKRGTKIGTVQVNKRTMTPNPKANFRNTLASGSLVSTAKKSTKNDILVQRKSLNEIDTKKSTYKKTTKSNKSQSSMF